MLGLWNIENIDVPLKHQERKVLSHLTAISIPPKTSFYFFSFIESRIPPLAPNPDLLFYYIWVGKHVLWLSECCFHLQFYFVLQNHSGILPDPKAIVWKHFSKACKKTSVLLLFTFSYHFSCSFLALLMTINLSIWIQGKACFSISRKSQCYFLSFARCHMCNCLPASRSEITTTMPAAIKVSEAPLQQNTWTNT